MCLPCTSTSRPWPPLPGWVSGSVAVCKGTLDPDLGQRMGKQLRLPKAVWHVWLGDRGSLNYTLPLALEAVGHGVVSRVRDNQVVYVNSSGGTERTPPAPAPVEGQLGRVDQLRSPCADSLHAQKMVRRVSMDASGL